ncbi:hypothetical protein KI387_033608, partial [Taxus chinensis]
ALYYSLVPAPTMDDSHPKGGENEEKAAPPDTTHLTRAFESLWNALSSLDVGPVR